MRFSGLSEILEWKYGRVADTKEINDEMIITEWRHLSITRPTNAQIILDFQEYEAYQASVAYKKKRSLEYPPLGDQIDAIWKLLEKATTGINDLPADAIAVWDAVLGVKEKYPKPEDE